MRIVLLSLLMLSSQAFSQPLNDYDVEKIEVKKGTNANSIMSAHDIFAERWDTLAQPQFWKKIMTLSPDSCLINVAATRDILEVMSIKDWKAQSETQKDLHRDSLRTAHGLASNERIFVTTGKNDFYRFNDVYPSLSEGVDAFERNGVDPWYAQAILLIESPGQLKKSSVGAYGPFQLMPAVARAQGLKVTKYVDERKDFERSAYASSRLINRVCIPEAKRILDAHNLSYEENDLWFRLFVLHIYHAGAANVAAVVNKIDPEVGGQSLITSMWQNTAAQFGNNSQNYSQLALASQLILHDLVYEECDMILECAQVRID